MTINQAFTGTKANKMKKFTTFQKDELLGLLWIRQETIEGDIESATEFEAIDGNLAKLEYKIQNDEMNFTEDEIQWMEEELEMRMQIFLDNLGSKPDEDNKIKADISSLKNAFKKITTQ